MLTSHKGGMTDSAICQTDDQDTCAELDSNATA